jgi:putative acetyltransferase
VQLPNEMLEIKPFGLTSPEAQELIAELNAELSAMYPEEGANHFRLEPEEVQPGKGLFLIAAMGDLHLGCGALRRLDGRNGELKRMYVRGQARNRGVGRELVRTLETEAKKMGITRLLLETGVRQLAALELYAKEGFVQIPCYGEYVGSSLSICMAKDI